MMTYYKGDQTVHGRQPSWMESQELDQFVGQIVDNCRIKRQLSRESMSVVYFAQQIRPNRRVALTLFLLPERISLRARQQFCERFLGYCPGLMRLRHSHLLPLYGYGVWAGFPYLITPYRTEESLTTTLQRGAYTPTRALSVLEPVCAALEYVHRKGLVHGMLTPAHLLVSKQHPLQVAGLGLLPLLERRGIVPLADSKEYRLNIAGTFLAAPKYLAPDYLQGQTADRRSDIYSLGVILFELLRGSPLPHEVNPLEVLMQQEDPLPRSLHSVLRRALAEDADMRYQLVGDLLTAFAKAVEPIPWQRSPTAHPPSIVQPAPVRSSRTRRSNAKRARLSERLGRREVVAVLAGGLVAGMIGTSALESLKHPNAPRAVTPSHTGTAISDMKQATNTALAFNNPGDTVQRQSLLIHLSGGTFVAYKQGCTHSGVLVTYDSKTQMLICPAHKAIFDPAHGGRVVQGPATRPLPQVAIHFNSDGTITA